MKLKPSQSMEYHQKCSLERERGKKKKKKITTPRLGQEK
jgi:hypothetical protein